MNRMNRQKQKGIIVGDLQISLEALTTIIEKAVEDIEGIVAIRHGVTGLQHKKHHVNNLRIAVEDDKISIWLSINIIYGFVIPEVAVRVQQKVKSAIETAIGYPVASIDVHIDQIRISPK